MAPSVVERILASLRDGGDFRAMETTVSQVSQLASSEATSTSVLADAVLQDYGLAQKLLRLVNTAAFAQPHQVTTISRAVVLLGFERVRTVVMGLILFKHLQTQAKSPELVDALTMSFYSAILGRAIADQTSFADPEEAFISALFHNLGRFLVALDLPAEMEAIKASADPDPDAAVHRHLGMSYAAIGIAVARALNLPGRLANSMSPISGSQMHGSMTDEEKLGSLATLANGVTDTLASSISTGDKREAITRLTRSYGPYFATINGTLEGLISNAVTDLKAFSYTFRLDVPESSFVVGLRDWRRDSLVSSEKKAMAAASASSGLLEVGDSELHTDELPEATLTRGHPRNHQSPRYGLHAGRCAAGDPRDDVSSAWRRPHAHVLSVERCCRVGRALSLWTGPVGQRHAGLARGPRESRGGCVQPRVASPEGPRHQGLGGGRSDSTPS